jgi:hypothetical protein
MTDDRRRTTDDGWRMTDRGSGMRKLQREGSFLQ